MLSQNRPKAVIYTRYPSTNILIYNGAGFVVPVAGAISLMPGTGSNPAYRRVDVDVKTGKVKGLF